MDCSDRGRSRSDGREGDKRDYNIYASDVHEQMRGALVMRAQIGHIAGNG